MQKAKLSPQFFNGSATSSLTSNFYLERIDDLMPEKHKIGKKVLKSPIKKVLSQDIASPETDLLRICSPPKLEHGFLVPPVK